MFAKFYKDNEGFKIEEAERSELFKTLNKKDKALVKMQHSASMPEIKLDNSPVIYSSDLPLGVKSKSQRERFIKAMKIFKGLANSLNLNTLTPNSLNKNIEKTKTDIISAFVYTYVGYVPSKDQTQKLKNKLGCEEIINMDGVPLNLSVKEMIKFLCLKFMEVKQDPMEDDKDKFFKYSKTPKIKYLRDINPGIRKRRSVDDRNDGSTYLDANTVINTFPSEITEISNSKVHKTGFSTLHSYSSETTMPKMQKPKVRAILTLIGHVASDKTNVWGLRVIDAKSISRKIHIIQFLT